MDFIQLQEWVQKCNADRGWDLIPASMAMVHLLEELGELAEQIQGVSGVAQTNNGDFYAHEVAGEIADALILLVKIGVICNADLSAAITQHTDSLEFSGWTTQQTDEPIFTLDNMPLFIVCLLDRLGEISRHIMFLERFKNPDIRKAPRGAFSAELAYTIVLLVKTGERIGVNMSDLLDQKVERITKRFPPHEGSKETSRYLNHMQKEISRNLAEFERRFGSW